MRDFLNDLADWIPVLIFGLVLGLVAVTGIGVLFINGVIYLQQLFG